MTPKAQFINCMDKRFRPFSFFASDHHMFRLRWTALAAVVGHCKLSVSGLDSCHICYVWAAERHTLLYRNISCSFAHCLISNRTLFRALSQTKRYHVRFRGLLYTQKRREWQKCICSLQSIEGVAHHSVSNTMEALARFNSGPFDIKVAATAERRGMPDRLSRNRVNTSPHFGFAFVRSVASLKARSGFRMKTLCN
jgi:hypothetical protein